MQTNQHWICNTCYNAIKQNRIPALWKGNGATFPKLPECLELTNLEERLAAARIPLMQLQQLPRGGQLSIHGNVVNLPTNMTSTVSCLPRNITDEQTIPLKLKRKLQYRQHFQFQTVRPNRIISVVKWLVENSSLYKEEGIAINDNWESEYKMYYEEVEKMTIENICEESVRLG